MLDHITAAAKVFALFIAGLVAVVLVAGGSQITATVGLLALVVAVKLFADRQRAALA